jgi:hypothetical protein
MSVAVSDRKSYLEHNWVVFGGESINDRCILLLLRYAACLVHPDPFNCQTLAFLALFVSNVASRSYNKTNETY